MSPQRSGSPLAVQVRNVWPGVAGCVARVELLVVHRSGRTQGVTAAILDGSTAPAVRLIPDCSQIALAQRLRTAALSAWKQTQQN